MDKTKALNLNYLPRTSAVHFGFRQPLNSSQLNELHQNILEDLLELFNQSNEFDQTLSHLRYISTTESIFLRYRLNELEAKFQTLNTLYKSQLEASTEQTLLLFPHQFRSKEAGHEMEIDLDAMCATMKPTYYNSKVNLYDDVLGATYVSPSLQFVYGPSTTEKGLNILEIEDNGPQNAFDGDPTNYWVRRYVCKSGVTEVQCELIITLPDDILTNKSINQLKITPFPADAIDILSIETKTTGNWTLLPGFEDYQQTNLEIGQDAFLNRTENSVIQNSPTLKFNFKEITANQIRIRFRQQNFIQQELGNREFYIGAKNIEIGYASYHNQYYTFEVDADLPVENEQLMITQADLIYNNKNEIFDDPQLEFYWYDTEDSLHRINQTVPFATNKKHLMIRVKFFESVTTPNIKQLKLHYRIIS